ncbi:hypothetical protein [Nannocystis sp.]|uniref:WD40 repeat domain-containing protein n=1 Tax=Nannocystis sp. TaxID=1962667 RepID=UPI0025D644F1|nr:hypothetical protein [Nannocystis sp.]
MVHSDPIESLAFSSDGRRLVVAGGNTARLLSVADGVEGVTSADGVEGVTLTGHEKPVRSVAFSADGARVVTGSDDQTVRVWRTADGVAERVLHGPDDSVIAVESSGDHREVVATTMKNLWAWQPTDLENMQLLPGDGGSSKSVEISPDGSVVLTGSGYARTWPVIGYGDQKGWPRMGRSGHDAPIDLASFSPDGAQFLTIAKDDKLRIWRMNDGDHPLVLAAKHPLFASFKADGQAVLTVDSAGEVREWPLCTPDSESLTACKDALWRATSFCLSVQQRIERLGSDEEDAKERQRKCREDVAKVR